MALVFKNAPISSYRKRNRLDSLNTGDDMRKVRVRPRDGRCDRLTRPLRRERFCTRHAERCENWGSHDKRPLYQTR